MPTAPKKPAVRPVDHEGIREMLVTVVNEVVEGKVEAKLAEIKESLHKVMECLTGNGFGVSHGLINRVTQLEADLKAHSDKMVKDLASTQAEFHAFRQEQRDAWAKVKWTFTGIGIGAGLSGGGIVYAAIKVLGGG